MLSVASASVLVAGSIPQKTMALKIKVIRPFMFQGKAQPIGTVLEVSNSFAHDMVTMKKAEIFKEPEAAAPDPKAEPAKPPKGK